MAARAALGAPGVTSARAAIESLAQLEDAAVLRCVAGTLAYLATRSVPAGVRRGRSVRVVLEEVERQVAALAPLRAELPEPLAIAAVAHDPDAPRISRY